MITFTILYFFYWIKLEMLLKWLLPCLVVEAAIKFKTTPHQLLVIPQIHSSEPSGGDIPASPVSYAITWEYLYFNLVTR
jgi:hypothetical protein